MTGEELRRLRIRMALTQAAFADRLGVTPNTVARWERDEVGIAEPAARLARLLVQIEEKDPRRGKGRTK